MTSTSSPENPAMPSPYPIEPPEVMPIDHEVQPIEVETPGMVMRGIQGYLRTKAETIHENSIVQTDSMGQLSRWSATDRYRRTDDDGRMVKHEDLLEPVTKSQHRRSLRATHKTHSVNDERSTVQYNLRRSFGDRIADDDYIAQSRQERISAVEMKARIRAKKDYDKSVRKAGDSFKYKQRLEAKYERNHGRETEETYIAENTPIRKRKLERKIDETISSDRLSARVVRKAYDMTSIPQKVKAFAAETRKAWNQESAQKLNLKISGDLDEGLDGTNTSPTTQRSESKLDKFRKNRLTRVNRSIQRTSSNQPRRYRTIKKIRRDAKDLVK